MYRYQCKDTGSMKKQGNKKTSLAINSNEKEIYTFLENNFKNYIQEAQRDKRELRQTIKNQKNKSGYE